MEYRGKEKINLPVEESIVIAWNKQGEDGWEAVNIYGGPSAANIDVVGAANPSTSQTLLRVEIFGCL